MAASLAAGAFVPLEGQISVPVGTTMLTDDPNGAAFAGALLA